jgi:hypothetical protein
MKAARSSLRALRVPVLMAAGALASPGWLEAHTKPRPVATPTPSATAGRYCGGAQHDQRGLPLDLNRECKTVYGSNASAVTVRQDAYGWVCRIPGKRDVSLDMPAACRRAYGDSAMATLVGIGARDWRCLRPDDVTGRVVPVLLFPREKLKASEAPFVTATLARLGMLIGGVTRFYADRTANAVTLRGTNAFVLPTGTSAGDWQNLALATDHAVPGFPLARFEFHNRVKKELGDGGWSVLQNNSKFKIGGFVTLGSSFSGTPTWYGAAADPGGTYFSQPPATASASCDPKKKNSGDYERAFYGGAHELGHTFGLDETDTYPFDGSLRKPSNWSESVMYQGKGTASELFDFETKELKKFLGSWP